MKIAGRSATFIFWKKGGVLGNNNEAIDAEFEEVGVCDQCGKYFLIYGDEKGTCPDCHQIKRLVNKLSWPLIIGVIIAVIFLKFL